MLQMTTKTPQTGAYRQRAVELTRFLGSRWLNTWLCEAPTNMATRR
jgi:hypothetical protein